MKREQALAIVKRQINGPRYEHTIRVTETAVELAKTYGVDVMKTELAALFHDYAKLHPIAELQKMIVKGKEDLRLLDYHPELWHGPAAAYIISQQFDIHDREILHAIRYHTTGRADMSLLEKIIYIADYIEPGRQFPGVEEVRDLAHIDLDAALLKALGNTITFLLTKQAAVFPDTFAAYNSIVLKKGGSSK
ncbi:bis(5'-nucleosyl)-tetraphosphatase (symmetrical) YqeK [Bacillus sp. FJAT-50079]|uniref:bis(5'-nucleosyl)-tetraphosphatase (symmetrical) YqeK n=1 Tax=Bacillus sp. FJAT-50079 TaxID=2833577 RepID=UPI001BC9F9AB|nr:bis(5'-nucleosyl)-tetraphosphatase (symmetrical) YqeK [Bacillus sp. FJAT-50079]MBS4209042.1 bis(5'-nucleosyl)-tetraphosphatase (symmetrical) YqeK [Bacillus sp. FJAT-50079]